MIHRLIIICLFIVLTFNCFSTYSQNSFSERTSFGVALEYSFGSYHRPLFLEGGGYYTGTEYTIGAILKYDLSKNIDIETGMLFTGQKGLDYRDYWSYYQKYPDFEYYSVNMLYTQIPAIARLYPLGNESTIYPHLDFGFRTGFLLGGIITTYSYSENNANEDYFNVEDREVFSMLFNNDTYRSFKYKAYTNIILGGGVNIKHGKLNLYCGINFPIGLINSYYSQFSLQSISFVTAVYF